MVAIVTVYQCSVISVLQVDVLNEVLLETSTLWSPGMTPDFVGLISVLISARHTPTGHWCLISDHCLGGGGLVLGWW